ncbi:MAG: WhiB family transcriptional regulator [Egibacteraceae bacterium]
MVRERSWQARAACRGTDVELFYSEQEADIQAALALCARCEVLTACYARPWSTARLSACGEAPWRRNAAGCSAASVGAGIPLTSTAA